MSWENVVELAELAEECALAELAAFGSIEPEEEPPEEEWDVRAYLWARMDMLEEELDEWGGDDALDWEKWDEYERVSYALAEHELGIAA